MTILDELGARRAPTPRVDPAELVPETPPRVGPGSSPRASTLVPKANHFTLSFIGAPQQTVQIPNADWVRVVSDALPVEVYADGELVYYPVSSTLPGFLRAPSIDFVLRKRVETLTIGVPLTELLDSAAERRRVQGVVDVFYGRGDVEVLGPGSLISGSAHEQYNVGGVATITTAILNIALWGVNLASDVLLGRLWISSLSLKVAWTGAAGVIQEVALLWQGSAVTHDLWRRYANDTPPVIYELNTPAHIPCGAVGANSGPELYVLASANMNTLDAVYNWEGVA